MAKNKVNWRVRVGWILLGGVITFLLSIAKDAAVRALWLEEPILVATVGCHEFALPPRVEWNPLRFWYFGDGDPGSDLARAREWAAELQEPRPHGLESYFEASVAAAGSRLAAGAWIQLPGTMSAIVSTEGSQEQTIREVFDGRIPLGDIPVGSRVLVRAWGSHSMPFNESELRCGHADGMGTVHFAERVVTRVDFRSSQKSFFIWMGVVMLGILALPYMLRKVFGNPGKRASGDAATSSSTDGDDPAGMAGDAPIDDSGDTA